MKEIEAETVIISPMGYFEDGMYCSCSACPYWVVDVEGKMACYMDDYKECHDIEEES